MKLTYKILVFFLLVITNEILAQGRIYGSVTDSSNILVYANLTIEETDYKAQTDIEGKYTLENIPAGTYDITASFIGFNTKKKSITIADNQNVLIDFVLEPAVYELDEVVISGTMKPVIKLESAVPVDIYTPTFFKANPVPSVYEALQNINGIRPQVNCAVCNTGDIHINGLEGAYTMVMIDGMPIVSGLSTVYGLNGIPQSLIERIETVKGPASTLYGSEAVGGLINIITVKPDNAPLLAADLFATSWGEINTDVAGKFSVGEKVQSLAGVNYFNFQNRIDNNNDNFTDITLQERISLFNTWNFKRKDNRIFTIAGRYVYEDRFGGEIDWQKVHRGGNQVYGESIYTSRWEIFGTYQLPLKERVIFMFSANEHDQNSVYGETWYIADQKIGFGQFVWNKELGIRHDITIGSGLRYTYYDDNTPATAYNELSQNINQPSHTYLPGVFIQDEFRMNENHKLLLGFRYDYNSLHGSIYTPRLNYKWNSNNKLNILRLGFGTGYRVANVFTEDHAALTGARELVFLANLAPERSYNTNLNLIKKIYTNNDLLIGLDASLFYTYFNNKIFADYESDPNQIIYDNLSGYAVSNGFSLNIELEYKGISLMAGGTAMDVYSFEEGVKKRQMLTEQYSGTWKLSYQIPEWQLSFDYTGNLYGPMLLPLLGEDDPRPELSPWWSIQNIQSTKRFNNGLEIFGGVKNLLNWTPWKNMTSDMIARAHDPFDKNVSFDDYGNALATPNNPNGLTFDPSYVYGPNQGIRFFLGLRYNLR